MQRTTFLKLRVSHEESALFTARAEKLGISVSQLIRDCTLRGAVKVTIEKSQAGYDFRRLGAMLKHLYPAGDSRWTVDDRKKWWALVQELRAKADKLEAVAAGASDEPVKEI